MKNSLSILLIVLFSKIGNGQQDTVMAGKTGWLFYNGDKVIWFESSVNKKVKNKSFFKAIKYSNGLVVNYIPEAKYDKAIAQGYSVNVLVYNNSTKKAEYSSTDSIWILPVKVKYVTDTPSELLTPNGLSFKKKGNEITVDYNFKTTYDISDVELLRKSDKRKLKRIKNYVVFPPH